MALNQCSCNLQFLMSPSRSPDCVSLSEMYLKLELFNVLCKSSFLFNFGVNMAENQTLNCGNLPWQITGKPQRSFFHKGSPSLAMSNIAGAPYSRDSVSTTLPSIPPTPEFFWALRWMLSSKREHPTPSRSLRREREDRTCTHIMPVAAYHEC